MNLTARQACCGCGGGNRNPQACEDNAIFMDAIGDCNSRAMHRSGCEDEIVRFYCPKACALCSLSVVGSDSLLESCEDDREVQADCDAFAAPAGEDRCSNEVLAAALSTRLEALALAGFNSDVFERFRARCPFSCRLCQKCPSGFRLELDYRSYDAQVCQKCTAGQYQPLQYSTVCFECEPGLFTEQAGSSSCKRCPEGHTSQRGAQNCTLCPAGSIPDAVGAKCELCPVGSTSSMTRNRCELCKAGTFAAQTGSSGCKACAPGQFSVQGSATCMDCLQGQVTSRHGSEACQWCPPGKYSDLSRSSRCKSCEFGTVTSGRGSTALVDCQTLGITWSRPFQ